MRRAYNDDTYLPPSQASNTSNPGARVNGRFNAVIVAGATGARWWRELASEADALLIDAWSPARTRAQPVARPPR